MAVTSFQDFTLADADRDWDGDAADKRVRRWAGAEDEPNEKYRDAHVWYDANNKDLPDGADSTPACIQFENAKGGFLESKSYQNAVLKRETLVPLKPPALLPQVREAAIEADMNGKHALIYVWLTTAGKQLLKLQLMTKESNRDRLPEVRRLILDALGTAIAPHLAPDPDPNAKPAENAININGFGAADDEMQFGFTYLGTLSAIIDKQPERGPVCGGVYDPRFEEDLAAYQMAIKINDGSALRSSALKGMIAADKAGFLDELVWTHLKRESWGAVPPEGLDLAAFEPWRKKNLKRFKLDPFGSVVAGKPRPLPVATD